VASAAKAWMAKRMAKRMAKQMIVVIDFIVARLRLRLSKQFAAVERRRWW
jgi:hypothetical protein